MNLPVTTREGEPQSNANIDLSLMIIQFNIFFNFFLLLANFVLLLLAFHPAVAFAAVGDGAQHHKRQSLYQNVFFSELPRMKGRPSTSFVMVSCSLMYFFL